METLKAAARTVLAKANQPIGSRRLARTLAIADRPLKIELGGGLPRHGWIITNVGWNAHYYLDATAPWPVESDAVQYVFADNVVEHLTLHQCRSMLRCAREAMMSGGILRLATPDLQRLARLYLDGEQAAVRRIMTWHQRADRQAEHPADLLRIYFTTWGHEKGYLHDLSSLTLELSRAGFDNVRRCKASESDYPELRGLESRLDEEVDLQLVVEAEVI